MKTPALLLAMTASLASPALCQSHMTVPQGFENSYTGNTSLLWRSTQFRYQCQYDESHFVNQGINHPIQIDRLRFRPLNGIVNAGGQTYTGVTIKLSSSPTNYDTMATTFALNEGLDVVTVYTGNVVLLPTAGGAPNDHHIDIVLQTPFVYDPTLGLDLCVDVEAPNAPSASVPNMAASNDYVLHKARRMSTTTFPAVTGGLSGFAAAMKIDYTILQGTAMQTPFGEGCNNGFVTFYEESTPGTFDLGGSPGVVNSIRLLPQGGGYVGIPGTNGWYTPTSPDLLLADDSISAAQPLSFTFNYPGGSTTSLIVESNGNVWLQPPAHASFICAPGGASLVSRGAVFNVAYHDLNPDPTTGGMGSIHFDEDTANGVAYVTWLGVPDWIAAPPSPYPTNTFQLALYSSGEVEFRFQEIDGSLSWANNMTGFSPGANNRNPGSMDISASLPFVTMPDVYPVQLEADARPILGNTINLVTSELQPTTVLTATVAGFQRLNPGLSLGGLGMPGCTQFVVPLVQLGIGFGAPTSSVVFNVPNAPSFSGVNAYAQSATLDPSGNVLGVLVSNGLELKLGTL